MEKIKFRKNHRARMVMLLVLMLVGVSASWGQTTYGKVEFTKTPTTAGWTTQTDQGTVKVWTHEEGDLGGNTTIDSKLFIKLNSTGFVKIRVAKGTVFAGDILRVEVGHFYDNTDAATLGFKVNGSGGSVYKSNVTDRNIYSLDYVLKAEDINIDTDDSNYDFIQFNRGDTWGGCAYHSVEILRYTRHTVTWDDSNIPSGCDAWFTIEGDANQYRATKTDVLDGASVTFHGTDTGNDTKMINGWNNPGGDYWGWGSTKTVTVNSNISVKPDFQDCILLKLTTSPAEGGTATVTVNGNDANGKKFFQSVKPTFTASVNTASGYSFDGWYDGSAKVSSDISYNADFSGGAMVKNIVAKFKASTPTHKNTPKPTCGGMYFNQSYLEKGANIESFEISGGKAHIQTSTSQVGYVSFFFETPINLTEINKWTVGCENASSIVDYVAFCKEGNIINRTGGQMIFNNNANDRILDNQYKEFLTSVDEIRIGFKPNTTTTIDYFYLDIKHNLASKKPVLVSPTATEMSIFTDETLQLRISDIHGFWREFTDDTYTTPKFDHIGHDSNGQAEWKSSYDISNLPVGHYYFGIKDEGTCAIGNHHETDLVTVHVNVRQAIHSINVNGTTRHYDVYAPAGISGTVGVVVSLHGASNDYDNGRVDFNDIAYANKDNNDKKFVVVYPRGLMRQLRGTERGWETYTEDNTEDVDFFKAIVNNLNQEFNGQFSIDYNRIYLAGFSNGGMMAYKAAHQAGDFFKAFASVGGYPVNESHLFHAGKQPTPFIHIQGKADGIFPNSTYPLDVIAHNMVYRNGAKFNPWTADEYEKQDGGMITSPKDGENKDIIEKDCHAALPGGAAYYMYKVAGMGHTWTYDWDNDVNHTDDVAATIWKFFNKEGIVNAVDPTLKFRFDDSSFWSQASGVGFDNVNSGTSVLSYGGRTKTDNAGATYDKDSNNKNLYHTLQFDGGTFGAPHYMKLQVYTELAQTEDPNQYFVVELTKTGDSKPVFRKRYQAGRGEKPLYINFTAQSYFNEYKLTITKSSSDLVVTVKGVEFHSGKCQDVGAEENPVFFQDVASVLMGMNPIYQPVYDQSFDALAKEYLPIADIPVHDKNVSVDNRILADDLHYTNDGNTIKLYEGENPVLHSTLVESWDADGKATVTRNQVFNLAHSGKTDEDTEHKLKNAFIVIPVDETYTVDKTKGINISEHGIANMPAYVNGGVDDFPSHGMIAFKVQGTVDFTLLAVNDIEYDWANVEPSRRLLKVYYVNDQMDGKPQWLKDWNFFGERTEQNHGGLNTLDFPIRLPQLGKDGTCTVFITYEGNGGVDNAEDHDKIWFKGVVFHRPDLKVTIGRTDELYKDKYYDDSEKPKDQREHNTFCTHYGVNKPYVWSFQNVGFKNDKTADLGLKKINEKDGRTYVCGTHADEKDHLLVYSDINSSDNNDKVQFDGRVAGQEHIEFRNASKYNIPDGNLAGRNVFDPIQANGLKVNVTGSGWFKIRCSAPNGPVNMKVYSSTNYGPSYINLLREFRVEKTASETDWQEYTVYLKGHINRIAEKEKPADQRRAQEGFWDGDPANAWDEQEKAEEVLRMSLFVVYDEIDGETYPDEDGNHPQLNIHELSWLNEKPADYVFQREEDPKLLTTWQEIKRKGKTVLWWKAGNDSAEEEDPNYVKDGVSILAENTYNRLGQFTSKLEDTSHNNIGEKSPEDYASTTTTADSYKAYWDIAAPATRKAHTEAAYGGKKPTDATNEQNQYNKGSHNTEFDIPVSGSFIRLCVMQNTYVVAHILPGHNGSVYVLDETGNPIPYKPNGADLNDEAKKLGYVSKLTNANVSSTNCTANSENGGTIRIDFTANAGKEYFIVGNGSEISLARLEVVDDQYSPNKGSQLSLRDNENNSSTINTTYTDATNYNTFYRSATLTRTFAQDVWASLVLPFSVNEQMFKKIFGENAKCLHFTNVDKETNTVRFTHHYYNMIVAGRPVFVRPD
ncbi:MAG: prolyl oligopeptidase family serine peptidase, partial [Prevotellaceae bacterium]|nr:prolyl oligopeptidase family serine peptidase [Candidatus Colivivens equi]